MLVTNRLDRAIITALHDQGPLDDDQLGDAIGTSRQSARAAALRMSVAGVVVRRKGSGKWTTELSAGTNSRPPVALVQSSPALLPPIDLAAVSDAIGSLQAFLVDKQPRVRVGQLEQVITGAGYHEATAILQQERIDDDVLRAALLIKRVAGEVNVVIHALGIMLSLPHLLEQTRR